MARVAVVGASSDRNKFGNKALRAYVRQGWEVFPVHHKEAEIEGIPTVASLDDLDGIDRVTFYVPPAIGIASPSCSASSDKAASTEPGVWYS